LFGPKNIKNTFINRRYIPFCKMCRLISTEKFHNILNKIYNFFYFSNVWFLRFLRILARIKIMFWKMEFSSKLSWLNKIQTWRKVTKIFLTFFLFSRICSNVLTESFVIKRPSQKVQLILRINPISSTFLTNTKLFHVFFKVHYFLCKTSKGFFRRKFRFFNQNFDFSPTLRFLTKVAMFDQNWDFSPKLEFLTEITIFCRKLRYLNQFDKNSYFWPKLRFFAENLHFWPIISGWKFAFIIYFFLFKVIFLNVCLRVIFGKI